MDPWSIFAVLAAAVILVPLLSVVFGLSGAGPKWDHLSETVLSGYVANTAILLVSVSVLSLLFAIPPAWIVSTCNFPGRRFFEWALVMPLAIPTYVIAFVYFQVIDASIPLQVSIRRQFGIDAYLASEKIFRYGLLATIMASVLAPYLFLTVRAAFSRQCRTTIEAARTLGRSPLSVFFTVALPLSRPTIIAGLSLIIMEVLNDYGAVNLFGVPTLTEGIFRTWFGLGDRDSALRLAGLVMLAILILIVAERWLRGNARFTGTSNESAPPARRQLRGAKALMAVLVCFLPLLIGFLFPVYQLGAWSLMTYEKVLTIDYWSQLSASFALSLGTSVGLTALAVFFVYTCRIRKNRAITCSTRLASLGYAAPGAVVAVGVMVTFGLLDRGLAKLGVDAFLSGTLLTILFAYFVRFLAVAFQPVQAGMTRISPSVEEASRLLGKSPLVTLFRLNLPLLGGTLFAATMLVFVDILKELPLTMILRPANFDTLATTAFGLAKEGRIQECAVPSLAIIITGAIALMTLNHFQRKTELQSRS